MRQEKFKVDDQQDTPESAKGKESSKQPQESRAKRLKTFCYDGRTNKFCGRTCLSWLLLSLYYIFAWGVFVALFAIILSIDYRHRDKNQPQYNMFYYQPILQEPGMTTIPVGLKSGAASRIEITTPQKIQANIDEIKAFLKDYPQNAKVTDCKGDNPKPCAMKKDNEMLGPCSPNTDPTFGYKTKEPCVFIKVNKLWGWTPKLYTRRPDNLPPNFEFSPTSVPVSCEAWGKLKDRKYKGNFSEVTIHPSTGLLGSCFPYCGPKKAFAHPFIAVKFRQLDPKNDVGVLCMMHAQNIIDIRTNTRKLVDKIGGIFFILSAESSSCNLCLASILFYLPLLMMLRNVQLNF